MYRLVLLVSLSHLMLPSTVRQSNLTSPFRKAMASLSFQMSRRLALSQRSWTQRSLRSHSSVVYVARFSMQRQKLAYRWNVSIVVLGADKERFGNLSARCSHHARGAAQGVAPWLYQILEMLTIHGVTDVQLETAGQVHGGVAFC